VKWELGLSVLGLARLGKWNLGYWDRFKNGNGKPIYIKKIV
jgi:hypothetical protein